MHLTDDLKNKIVACAETIRDSRKHPERLFDPVGFIYAHGGKTGIFPYEKPLTGQPFDEFCYILKEGDSFTVYIDDRADEGKETVKRGLYAYCVAHMICNMKYFWDREAFTNLPDGKYAPQDGDENTRALALSVCLLIGRNEFSEKKEQCTKKGKTDYVALARCFNVTEYTARLRDEMVTEG